MRYKINFHIKIIFFVAILSVLFFYLFNPEPIRSGDFTTGSVKNFQNLMQKAEQEGEVGVIVSFELSRPARSFSTMSRDEITTHRGRIRTRQNEIAQLVEEKSGRVRTKYNNLSAMALTVSPAALEELKRAPRVESITPIRYFQPFLDDSTEHTEAKILHGEDHFGTNQIIAVLDTGVDTTHPVFEDKNITEACFTARGNCPNGEDSMKGPGAAVNYSSDYDGYAHGTHVAGIAVGKAAGDIDTGVAPGADLIAINIFYPDGNNGLTTSEAELLAGLDHVIDLAVDTFPDTIAAVNLSLGMNQKYSKNCDNDFSALAMAINDLEAANIVTVVSSGNNGWPDGITAPACISTAVAVGAVKKNKDIWDGSNLHPDLVDFVAPGVSIKSAAPDNNNSLKSDGTSMAAPHLAGAFALLRAAQDSDAIDVILHALRETGESVYDIGGEEYRLLQVAAALDMLVDGFTVTSPADRISDVYSWPNPARMNQISSVKFSIPEEFGSQVRLEIYNLRGRLVEEETLSPSGLRNIVYWYPDLASGTYIYVVHGENGQVSSDNITVIR